MDLAESQSEWGGNDENEKKGYEQGMMYQLCVRRNRFWNNCEEHKTGLVIKQGEKIQKKKEKIKTREKSWIKMSKGGNFKA